MVNKKVIVTGGNRGIGKGIVLSLLENGHEVLATCRTASNFDFSLQSLSVDSLDISDLSLSLRRGSSNLCCSDSLDSELGIFAYQV